jgi:hypothetical protein
MTKWTFRDRVETPHGTGSVVLIGKLIAWVRLDRGDRQPYLFTDLRRAA